MPPEWRDEIGIVCSPSIFERTAKQALTRVAIMENPRLRLFLMVFIFVFEKSYFLEKKSE
jgi:hypothetical protein